MNPSALYRFAIFASVFLVSAAARAQEDDFALGVRKTDALTPVEEKGKFKLPPGFEIQLVATEPDINKPFNMAFDATGRLWVTTSIEYPYAAPLDKVGRDRLMIFEDFGPDGKARKVTEFANGLNIPIGVYPFRNSDNHWKAIVWSIPNIWLLEDTDGDGKADRKQALYGPFDHTRDTHGNQASFRRGFDGWLYGTHGFNNDSHVTARDGSHVDLNSGNTYRVLLDGSRIEHHTHGQVNPFGLAWDARGNLYSSDCHSAPIYQLLSGGFYPSFGKPDDGLGFAPVMLEHAHGSTAIDGAFYYEDNLWPEEYRDTFFIGNVMTSRLNRDKITFTGSTPKANEQPDFLTTTDPWFRPVDNILGPDGALYIADFYNRIIGHYEVPLTHPGRDRERGRLWRVVYKGDGAALRPAALPSDLAGLVSELGSPNLPRRLMASAEIQDRFGDAARSEVRKAFASPSNTLQKVHSLWMLQRLKALTPDDVTGAFASSEALLRIHAQRVATDILYQDSRSLAASRELVQTARKLAMSGLRDADALVRRCAAEALGIRPDVDGVRPLLDVLAGTDAADTHLVYVLRKSLRDHLAHAPTFEAVIRQGGWSESDLLALTDVAIAVQSPQSATFLLSRLEKLPERSRPTLGDVLKHGARNAPESELPKLAQFVRGRFADRTDFQLALFQSVDQGLQQRGVKPPEAMRAWGAELVDKLLSSETTSSWMNFPIESAPTQNPWDFQERRRVDGKAMRVLSSFPKGEPLTGTVRSPEFMAGPSFSFWLCGHDGHSDRPALKKNGVRLRDAATGAVLFEAAPPRDDAARQVVWDTGTLKGRKVYFEATDSDTGDAFAWIAFGDIEGGPALPAASPRAQADRVTGAADLASRLGLQEVAPRLKDLALRSGDSDARAAAAKGFAALNASDAVTVLGSQVLDTVQPIGVRERFGVILAEMNSESARTPVLAALKGAPYRVQQRWATALSGTRDGADAFLKAVEQGDASPRILQSAGTKTRIQRANPTDWQARLDRLTKDMPAEDETRAKLITSRINGYAATSVKADEGRKVFEVNCAACHQIDGKGGLVGPQLTGIGNRGVERLCEDILDPNRNVDHAFRQTVLTLKDGETMAGLFRREEGNVLVLANATGAEFTVPKADVAKREESPLSLMPENFGEAIPEGDFQNLMAFLLSHRGTK